MRRPQNTQAIQCSVCGHLAAEGARYCGRCGALLASPPGGEFRPRQSRRRLIVKDRSNGRADHE